MFSAAARTGRKVTLLCVKRLPVVTASPLARGPRRLHTGLPFRCASDPGAPPPASSPGDPERFGSLSQDLSSRRFHRKSNPYLQNLKYREEDQEKPGVWTGRRNTQYWYFLQCKKLIKRNKLQEALDMFKRDMLEGEQLMPEEFNYSVLIGGCARAGQLKKAFKLYNDMKKRAVEPLDATYTALFNACAETPDKRAGLEQALKLEQELKRKNYQLNRTTYHALLKVHALNNHLKSCIFTIQEMLEKGLFMTPATFHYLLMACQKEQEVGFRMALTIWRHMLCYGLEPDKQNYILLLRTARDCGFGDPALAAQVLLSPGQNLPKKRSVDQMKVLEEQLFQQPEPIQSRDVQQDLSALIPAGQNQDLPPNLLDLFEGKPCHVVSLGSAESAVDRLALIGGAKSVLDKMTAKGLSPDVKTLSLLADMMEPGPETMQTLITAAKAHGVKLDSTFFNSAIRTAAKAGSLKSTEEILQLMTQLHLRVDIRTFGCLALGCEQKDQATQLLQDMKEAGILPNNSIFSAMIGQAVRRLDYVYLRLILKTMRDLQVWPNELVIRQLEFAVQYPPDYDQFMTRNNYLVQIEGFRGYYHHWLREMPAVDGDDQQKALESRTKAAGLISDGSISQSRRRENRH